MSEQGQNSEPVKKQEAIRKTEENGKVGRLQEWSFTLRQDESKPVAVLRSWLRIIFIMIHEFSETKISLRASALTYSIVLSMVPMLAMSTAVLKGLGGGDQLRVAAYQFIDQFESEPVELPDLAADNLPVPDSESQDLSIDSTRAVQQKNSLETDNQPSAKTQSITIHLRSAVDTIFDYVDRTNFAAIGAFGIIGLLLAVILVMSTIEEAMNSIWHTKRGRSLFRKIMDYLALIILLPVSINVALAGDAIIASPTILAHLHTVIPSEWIVTMILKFLPFLFVILTLMVMYMFFPTVKVKTNAAFAGAVFAGFFWFLVQKAYIILQLGVSKYNAIYGSFATVPLFLIWVQLGWTFILLGASLAYAVQNRNQYYLPGSRTSPQRDLQLAFDILNTTYTNFAAKKPTTFDDLVNANPSDQPGNIQELTKKLIKGGFIYHTDNSSPSYVPAAPAESIEAREVVQLILGHEEIPTIGGQFSQEVIKAAESAISPEAFPAILRTVLETPVPSTDPAKDDETAETAIK